MDDSNTVVLSDKRKVVVDLSKVSHREFAAFWDEKMTAEEKSAFMVKVCGLTMDQIDDLPEPDWREFRRVFRAVSIQSPETQAKN